MVQVFNFHAIQNQDDSPDMQVPGQHLFALNGRFKGLPGKYRFENIEGNTLINNVFLQSGTNICIGAKYDQVRNRIYYAIYNSNGNHSIYMLAVATGIISIIIQQGTNTSGTVLDFTADPIILNWNIVYGDSTQGDSLYWINTKRNPCQINIDRAISGGYGQIQRSYIDVCREVPEIPPQVIYQNDPAITVNNLRKKLFKFKYRFIFDDNTKSVWTAHSEVPLPLNPFDHAVDSDPTQNCVIPIVVQTGKFNVKKIEIAGSVSLGTTFSDFFSIIVLDKTILNIPSDEITTYLFYNDQAYIDVDPTESILQYDDVPLEVNAQELLNGNTLFYGGIKKNYPNLTLQLYTVVSSGTNSDLTTTLWVLFFAAQGGESVYGVGNIHIVVYGNVIYSCNYKITFADGSNISFTCGFPDTTANVILGLKAAATTAGFTIISFDANNLLIFKSNTQLALTTITPIIDAVLTNSTWFVYDWWGRDSFGLQYFDQKGRPIGGVQTNSILSIQTIPYQQVGGVPQIENLQISISHTPPTDSFYYHIVRSKNLAENGFVYWVSDRTLKDASPAPDSYLYAYISIANLNTFVKNNSASPLGYTFIANDRIRFVKRYNGDGTTANLYTNKDYEIVDSPQNPTVNGVAYTGQFIKIVLPTTDATFDFGTGVFNNYLIKLYTPAQPVANGLNVYYEFSERYAIVNPGTGQRFHQGGIQNQNINTNAPAIINLKKGDVYFRTRVINTGVELIYQITGGYGLDSSAGRCTLGCTIQTTSYNDPNIVTGNSPFNSIAGFDIATNMDRYILRIISGTYTFRIIGTLIITFTDNRPGDVYQFLLINNSNINFPLSPVFDSSVAGTYSFNVDTTFTMNSGDRMFIFGYSISNDDHTRSMAQTTLTVTSQQVFTQGITDPNFSDYFQSSVNSNGRPWVIDPDARQTYFPALVQWGKAYEPDTNINAINRFYPSDFDEIDLSRGSILRFKVRERICRVFQERGNGQFGVYSKFIQDSSGQNQLTTTDSIITPNNIQYYSGEFGMANHPESLVSGKIQDYFVDPLRGYQCRLSGDGIIPISELYKGQYTIRDMLLPYNKTWPRSDSSNAKILGAYNYRDEEYVCALQTGTIGTAILPPFTFSFNETRNAYCSYFDYNPEFLLSAEDVIYSFLNGKIYSHNNSTTRCNFYGSQFPVNIIVALNLNLIEKKTWISVGELSNVVWECPLIYSNVQSYPGQRQESSLIGSDFVSLESMWHASFFRDLHSIGGIFDGDSLKGNVLTINFQVQSASQLVWLTEIIVKYIDSPLTSR